MRYTQTDYDNALVARRDLALGKKVTQAFIGGKQITYHYSSQTLALLSSLISEIEVDLGIVSLRTYAKNAGRSAT